MTVIDEDGRLFGFVNVIDALIVVLAVGVMAAGVVIADPLFGVSTATPVALTVQATVPAYVADAIDAGPVDHADIDRVTGVEHVETVRWYPEDAPPQTRERIHIGVVVGATAGEHVEYRNERIRIGREVQLDLERVVVGGVIVDYREVSA